MTRGPPSAARGRYDQVNTWDRVLTRTWDPPPEARPPKVAEMREKLAELRQKHRAAALPMGGAFRDLELLAYRGSLE